MEKEGSGSISRLGSWRRAAPRPSSSGQGLGQGSSISSEFTRPALGVGGLHKRSPWLSRLKQTWPDRHVPRDSTFSPRPDCGWPGHPPGATPKRAVLCPGGFRFGHPGSGAERRLTVEAVRRFRPAQGRAGASGGNGDGLNHREDGATPQITEDPPRSAEHPSRGRLEAKPTPGVADRRERWGN